MKYLASIIIPTIFSNFDCLRNCLESLKQQKFDKKIANTAFEILIICNTSSQRMSQIRSELKTSTNFSKEHTKIDIKWFCMGFNTGFVGAINAGVSASTSEYIVLLNDDTLASKYWLSELIMTQRKTLADMVASKIYLSDRKTIDSQGFGFAWRGKAEALNKNLKCSLSKDKDYWLKHQRFLPKTKMNEPFGPDAAAALYTRKLFDNIGMLEAKFFAYLEDVDLALRARQHGMFCAYADKAIVYHYKHLTSSKFTNFKSKQDFINWWKIIIYRYNLKIWLSFMNLIFIERLKNLSGYVKSKWNNL